MIKAPIAAITLCVLLLLPILAARGDDAVELNLPKAIAIERGGGKAAAERDLTVDLVRRQGVWQSPAWATVDGEPNIFHRVEVATVDEVGVSVDLRLTVHLRPRAERDPRTHELEGGEAGGTAVYHVQLGMLHKEGPHAWAGDYQGEVTPLPASALVDPLRSRPLPLVSLDLSPTLDEEDAGGPVEEGEPDQATAAPVEDAQRLDRVSLLRGGAVRGRAFAGVVGEAAPGLSKDWRLRIVGGEHPRLFFKKADLPRLREAAESPLGRLVMSRLRTILRSAEENGFRRNPLVPGYSQAMVAAGYGLLYQLTGDPRDAGRSQLLVEAALYTPHAYGEYHGPPMFLLGTAIAYDLWHDAWDEDFRELVQLYLERNIREIATLSVGPDPLRLGEAEYFANPKILSDRGSLIPHWDAHLRAAAGVAALAVMNDPISLPEPVPPDKAHHIKPAENYEPWVGVPIVKFTDNNMPAAWLINGPFYRTPSDPDPLEPQGSVAHARPEPGQSLHSGDGTVEWRAFYPTGSGNDPDPDDPLVVKIYPRTDARYWAFSSKMGGYHNATRIRPTAAGQRVYIYLYTVIDNDRDRVVQALPNRGSTGRGVRMSVNGIELRDGDVARLSPGLYPMMLEIPARGGYSNQAPRLAEYKQGDYELDLAKYHIGYDAHEAAGGALPGVAEHYEAIRADLVRYLRRDIGEHGWADGAGMGDYDQALMSVTPFLVAQRHLMGEDLSQGTGLSELGPTLLKVAAAEHIKYGSLFGTTGISRSLPFTQAEYVPASLWSIRERGLAMPLPHEAAMYLASLPFNAEAKAPDDSDEPAMSLLGDHPKFGVVTLATSWTDAESYLFTLNRGCYPDAAMFGGGNFTLRGLRHDWATGFGYADNASAAGTANIISLAGFTPAAPPRVIARDITVHPDGSARGTITLQLDRWTRDRSATTADDAQPVWTRSIALDLPAPDSESPATLVIADRVERATGIQKTWRMQTGSSIDAVALDPDHPIATLPGPTLDDGSQPTARLTFLLPDNVTLAKQGIDKARHGFVVARIDTPLKPDAMRGRDRLSAGIDELRREGASANPAVTRDDDTLDELEAELASELQADRAARANAAGEAGYFVSVFTISRDGEHSEPTITRSPTGMTIGIGELCLRYADGRLTWE